MYRLGELSDGKRKRMGAALLVVGAVLMAVAVIVVHYSLLPREETVNGVLVPIQVDYFGWIPHNHWVKFGGYIVALIASQMMIAGAALIWVLNQPMTWARAAFAAFLTFMELIIVFGIVPSEWLNFSQTDLDMSPAKLVPGLNPIPTWLLLGNEVSISQAAVKDAVSGLYHVVMIGAAGLFAWKIQDIGKPRPPQPEPVSPYGRPLVKGDS